LDDFLSGWHRIAVRAAADPDGWQRMHQEAAELQSGARLPGPTLAEVLARHGIRLQVRARELPRRAAAPALQCRTVNGMSVQPSGPVDGHDVIRLGDETAVVVPIEEYRTLRALRDRASAEEIEEAEMDAVVAQHKAWVAAGCPGARSHEDFMAALLGGQ
jgi:hypothetical protein